MAKERQRSWQKVRGVSLVPAIDLSGRSRLAVFFGAGLSRGAGIPTAAELTLDLLDALGANKREAQAILSARIPFELFLETVRERTDLRPLLDVFDSKCPTAYHFFLARLIEVGLVRTVATTNYDTLLENALLKVGLRRGSDFTVYSRPDEFDSIDWSSDTRRIIKLHGCISDRETVLATLGAVSSRLNVSALRPVVAALFDPSRHDEVLVMGYSCSDHFDISPSIRALGKRASKIVLIDHRCLTRREWFSENVAERMESNPFLEATGRRWYADTSAVVSSLWRRNVERLGPPRRAQRKSSLNWRGKVRDWVKVTDLAKRPALRSHILGRLLMRSNSYSLARTAMARSLRAAERNGDQELAAVADLNLGICWYRIGDLARALFFQRRALQKARRLGDTKLEGQSLGNLGNVHHAANRLRLAARFQMECLRLARSRGVPQLEANTFGNLGLVFEGRRQFECARRFHRRAAALSRKIGDPVGWARHQYNIGVTYRREGRHPVAYTVFRRAERASREVGQDELVASCLLGRARSKAETAHFATAEALALEAGRTFERVRSWRFAIECLELRAEVATGRGAFSLAKGLLKRGIGLARRLRAADLETRLLHLLTAVDSKGHGRRKPAKLRSS